MAENQDDIIILEEGEEENKEQEEVVQDQNDVPEKKNKKKIIVIAVSSVVLVTIILIAIILLSKSDDEDSNLDVNQITQNITEKESNSARFEPLKIERLIKKANILYKKGDKQNALKIYKEIASFNESISNYNIGVAKMKEKDYKGAMVYFKKAISNGQNRCVSAINCAVCAIKIKDQKLFRYYLNLAKVYLPYESDSPLYLYYAALINYYQRYYFESLIPIRHLTSGYYLKERNYMASKIDTFFGDHLSAINRLEKNNSFDNELTLGLLYAKIGEYNIAIKHFIKSYEADNYPLNSLMAMALSYIKIGYLSSAAKNIRSAV
ncbi:MAG: GTP pyrophosphokinase, partial [Epsilonproteobacteria bacterium]|nr:GTP pyrophosphokinase [Campylobacterota bacterium]